MKNIPFVPLPIEKCLSIARKIGLIGIGSRIANFFPSLKLNLIQAGIDLLEREYVAIALFASLFYFLLMNSLFFLISKITILPTNFFIISIASSLGLAFISFLYIILYPRLVVVRKIRDVEKNLLFALRHLLIQVRSGVTLFDSLASVSKADYGKISEEFAECVRKISTGMPQVDVLEELAVKNPSLYFRRSLWQITNALKSGADVGDTLEAIVSNLASEQRVMIRKYGSQLNPLAFMYMMFGVIIPSLGITFLIALSSFSGLLVNETHFWLILIFLIVFQVNFLGIVKSRRPSVEVYV